VKCDCGTQKVVSHGNLLNGRTNSCGCLNMEKLLERNTKHGGYGTPEYKVWIDIRSRCHDPKHWAYKFYGGRGITVCGRWDDFKLFLEDVGKKPSRKAVLLRIDTRENYTPENCKWGMLAGRKRRVADDVVEYTYAGMSMSLTDWAEYLETPRHVLSNRLSKGWSLERTLTLKYRKRILSRP
jgi:hypothetical protein